MLTAQEIAQRIVAAADGLGCRHPVEVQAELTDLAAEILADSTEAKAIAGKLTRALRLVETAPVKRAGDEDGIPFPAVSNGWTFNVTHQADGLWRVACRQGSKIMNRPNLSAAAVRAFDADHEWRAGVPE